MKDCKGVGQGSRETESKVCCFGIQFGHPGKAWAPRHLATVTGDAQPQMDTQSYGWYCAWPEPHACSLRR